jgi:hypothetical protein
MKILKIKNRKSTFSNSAKNRVGLGSKEVVNIFLIQVWIAKDMLSDSDLQLYSCCQYCSCCHIILQERRKEYLTSGVIASRAELTSFRGKSAIQSTRLRRWMLSAHATSNVSVTISASLS